MGKKKVLKQTTEDLLKEIETSEEGTIKTLKKIKSVKHIENCRVYIQATYNNTLITLTNENGNVLAWSSAGSLGFKGPKKATPYAASKVAEHLIAKIENLGVKNLEIFVKRIGGGREAPIRFFGEKYNIVSIKDITPIPHNGCRPKKPRRV